MYARIFLGGKAQKQAFALHNIAEAGQLKNKNVAHTFSRITLRGSGQSLPSTTAPQLH